MAYSRLDGYILTGLQTLPLRMGVTGRKRNYILFLQLISSGALNKYEMPSVCLICSCAVEPSKELLNIPVTAHSLECLWVSQRPWAFQFPT